MTLRLVPDEPRSPLALDDLPLGPWAGVEITAYATKTGTTWHTDTACPVMRSRPRSATFTQPQTGTLGDRELPGRLHCVPAGPLRDHLTAANRLLRFAHATDTAEDALAHGDLPVTVLPTADLWHDDLLTDRSANEPFITLVEAEQVRREAVVEQTRDQLTPSARWTARLVIANWLRAGRTKGQHQPHYAELLGRGVDVMESSGLRPALGARSYLNDHLAEWLDRVLTGQSMSNSTTEMVDRELERHAALGALREPDQAHLRRIADVLTAVGSRWQDTVEAMAAAHPGTVFAVFHRYGTSLDPTVIDTLVDTGPSAVIGDGNTVWVAALVPAALRLLLAERHHGLTGLVVLDEVRWGVTTDVCMAFLRSLVRSVATERFATRVSVGRGTGFTSIGHGADAPDPTIKLGGFGTGVLDRSLTAADCLPHLRNALGS